ncbi:MAG: nuclear transport factor 2 family protein [Deltaproteobacteria bacterium]|nr:nuclear transport factor 2 family protein [Deltaproteobacteria bacterium]MBW2362895.1 nuclear transport factor 2 family protein [Deltaproteobacteria bacterium]
MAATSEPKTVAENYFACMRASDISVVDLFHEDAELRGLGFRKQGKEQIREFYTGVIAGARPSPSPASPILAEGDHVFAEVYIALAEAPSVHAIDVFHVEAGRIRSLTYFTADYPSE